LRQKPLFCACGERTPSIAELCSRCYRMRRHSRDYFGGNREIVLARDRYRCASCGAGNAKLHVHHRQPGVSEPGLLITVCFGCHARLHRLASIHVWIPELLAVL
jgi:5-methylcytosine-specific restriction endonuclease McrA